MAQKRLLISLAHPDDESFGLGGLIAKYVSEGVDVYYICATRGNRGTVAPEFLEKYGTIDAIRDAELNCAADVLGFKEVFKFGYGDSNMMGHPDNQDPTCLWQADENVVTGQVVSVIRQIKPQVIITFDPYGGYGHPDHIFIHRATTRAFTAAADSSQYPDRGEAYQPQKLYYTAFPKNLLRFFLLMMRLRGENPRQAGTNKDMDFTKIMENANDAHTYIDVRRWLDQWDEAARCHASQSSPRTGMPRIFRSLLMGKQGLARHFPEPRPGERYETDIFQGVK